MIKKFFSPKALALFFGALILGITPTLAGEADLVVPNIQQMSPDSFNLLVIGMVISLIGCIFGFIEFLRIKKLQVHTAMAEIGNTIFETCKTYLYVYQ